MLDAAQLAPHQPVDAAALDVDWVALSGHKLYAPFGSGVLAGRADWLQAAEPYLAGGGASRTVARRADGGVDVEWHTTAARHEAGSPNVIGAYALASACRALTEAGFEALAARERELVARLRAGLAECRRCGCCRCSATTPRGWVCCRSSWAAGTARTSRRRCPPSTASGCATACSAPTRSSAGCWAAPRRLPRSDGAPDAAPEDRPLNAVRVSFGAGTPDEHVDRFLRAVRELSTGRCPVDVPHGGRTLRTGPWLNCVRSYG